MNSTRELKLLGSAAEAAKAAVHPMSGGMAPATVLVFASGQLGSADAVPDFRK
jgi:hypothetical protein